jgi:hypothetical protein
VSVKFDSITAREKKHQSPMPTGSTWSSSPEMSWHTSSSQNPWLEKEQTALPATSTLPPNSSNGEFAEKFDTNEKLMPIAIVGMGCRFPQDATSPEKLWDMILRKQSARSDIPIDRFNVNAFYHPDSDRNGMVSTKGILKLESNCG